MEDDHDDIHLDIHREADNLGKFASKMDISVSRGMSREQAGNFMISLLGGITNDCLSAGADIVGHIKAFMKAESGTLMGSLVDPQVGVNVTNDLNRGSFTRAELSVHIIVHGIWDPEVKEISEKTIERVMSQYGVDYKVLQDYFETEKSIAHHIKKEDD